MNELEAIIKFIYLGETNVIKDNFNTFLEVAESLEINGLASVSPRPTNESNEPMKKRKKRVKFVPEKNQTFGFLEEPDIDDRRYDVEVGELKDEPTETLEERVVDENIACEECDSKFTNEGSLYNHRRRCHGNKRYNCNDCELFYTRQDNLTRHRRLAHGDLIL